MTIKYSAGDIVYWLRSDGFAKGIVKTVLFSDRIYKWEDRNRRETEIKYYLLSDRSNREYQGDQVDQSLIFGSYQDMINYYNNKAKELQ